MTSPPVLCAGARPEICLSPKNIRIPAQEGLGSAPRPPEPRGKEQEEPSKRWGQQWSTKGKRGGKRRLFWAHSQQLDSDQASSRLVPSVQWSRARGGCPVIGTALSIRKTGPGTAPHRWVKILSCGFLFLYLKPSQTQKWAIKRKPNPLTSNNPNKILQMSANN